jgi:hypothetical protein
MVKNRKRTYDSAKNLKSKEAAREDIDKML